MKQKLLNRLLGTTVLLGLLWPMMSFGQKPPAYLELNDGKKKGALNIRINPTNGDAVLSLPNNQTQTFPKSTYRKAYGKEPKEWKDVMGMIRAKKYSEAIPVLETVVRKNKNLHWDVLALAMLGRTQVMAGEMKDAVSTFQDLVRRGPEQIKGDVFTDYLTALKETKDIARLESILTKTIKSGSREDAAQSHIIRGDMKNEKGDMEAAVLDYLKTALLYTTEKTQQAEANFKAGEMMTKLRHPKAQERYKAAVAADPDSEWGKKAKSKLK